VVGLKQITIYKDSIAIHEQVERIHNCIITAGSLK